MDNNEYGYDQGEEWITKSDGNKYTTGEYLNSKYGLEYGSSYADIVNNKGEKYREIYFDEPNGGIDDMYIPRYTFRYRYDQKQNKYIPTNEWFMDKVVYRKTGGNLSKVYSFQKGKPITKFGVYGGFPEEKNRTPQWDNDEDKIFNDIEDSNYLKEKGITYTKQGPYYLSNNTYIPGVIYNSQDNKSWNHYKISPYSLETRDKKYNLKNLSLEDYNDLLNLTKQLGLNLNNFYKDSNEAEYFRPNQKLQLAPIYQSRTIGNTSITHSNHFAPKIFSKAQMDEFNKHHLGDYSSWHIVDPDKGYDFNIRSGRLRDGGSRELSIYGKSYPKEWDQHMGIIRYNGIFGNKQEEEKALQRRNALNALFKAYGLQFDKNGGKLN